MGCFWGLIFPKLLSSFNFDFFAIIIDKPIYMEVQNEYTNHTIKYQ